MHRQPSRANARSAFSAFAFVFALGFVTVAFSHDDHDHGGSFPAYDGPGWDGSSAGDPPIDFPASKVELLSWISISEFGEFTSANDCWGYVSPLGREYAIIGLSGGTAFVDVDDPTQPEIVATVPGPNGLWRDIKTYRGYAYSVSESGGGIQVMHLAHIERGVVTDLGFFTNAGSVTTESTHNVAINTESGYLYRCGGGSGPVGLRIYDLNNPQNPVFVGEWHDRYVHDAQVVNWTEGPYAGREIAFACSTTSSGGGKPGLDILDVTDKSNIVHLGFTDYSWPGYSHQGWLTEDRQHFLLNDELGEVNHDIPTTTRVINVTDLENPFEETSFTNGNTSIGHNIYVRGNYSFHANYRSGLRIFDITSPMYAVEVGYFDTWPEDDNTSFAGMWSNYPFLPSGIVIASDIQKGLFILSVDEAVTPINHFDLDGDGSVDVFDLLMLLSLWGPCADCMACEADFIGDCDINVLDLLELLAHWD